MNLERTGLNLCEGEGESAKLEWRNVTPIDHSINQWFRGEQHHRFIVEILKKTSLCYYGVLCVEF